MLIRRLNQQFDTTIRNFPVCGEQVVQQDVANITRGAGEMVLTVAVIGSRGFKNLQQVDDYLHMLKELIPEFWVITGGAKGVDTRAVEWCKDHKIMHRVIRPRNPAKREEYLYRNVEMIAMADAVVAFWDKKSTGTAFGIAYAKEREKPIKVIYDG